jgi:hypothetical protein
VTEPAAADPSCRVKFRSCTDSTEVSIKVAGHDGVRYLIGARAGQKRMVEMETSNATACFDDTAPSADKALFIGSTSGARFDGGCRSRAAMRFNST